MTTGPRWWTRRRLAWVTASISVLVVWLAPVLRNDLQAIDQLDQLAAQLPESTSVLAAETRIRDEAGQCRGVAAKMLATTLAPERLRRHLDRAAGAGQTAPHLAWSTLGQHWLAVPGKAPISMKADSPVDLPALPLGLLTRWQALPDGVRRVVAFRTFPAAAGGDLRCLF